MAVEQLTRVAAAPGRVETLSLDLASLASVRAFAAAAVGKLSSGGIPPLHGLVCNAGVQTFKKSFTTDGFESTFGINHLGHFLLVNLLLSLLNPPAHDQQPKPENEFSEGRNEDPPRALNAVRFVDCLKQLMQHRKRPPTLICGQSAR